MSNDDCMQPGDSIAFEHIQGPSHLEAIREGVRSMGWEPSPELGQWDNHACFWRYLTLTSSGDLVWRSHPGDGRRWTPDRGYRWAEPGDELEPGNRGCSYADPTPNELDSPLFDAIWSVIKHWDVDTDNGGHHGATGNEAVAILRGIKRAGLDPKQPRKTETATWIDEFADRIDRGDERWWEDYEVFRTANGWKAETSPRCLLMAVYDGDPIRRAPRYVTVTLGGITFKAPETEAPEPKTLYYVPDHRRYQKGYLELSWGYTQYDFAQLRENRVHLDPKNAALHALAEREVIRQKLEDDSNE